MAQCPEGHEVRDGAAFCPTCGREVFVERAEPQPPADPAESAAAAARRGFRSPRGLFIAIGGVIATALVVGTLYSARSNGSGDATSDFCPAANAFSEVIAPLALPDEASPAMLRASSESLDDAGRDLIASSPSTLRDDAEALVAEYRDKATLYRSVDYDYTALSSDDQRDNAGLPVAGFESGERIDEHVQSQCGSNFAYQPLTLPPTTRPAPIAETTPDQPTTTVEEQATEKVIFTPFTSSGLASGLNVVASVGGRCQSSNVLSRSDAFRCFVDGELPSGGNIADPCFSDGFGTRSDLICVGAPDEEEVVSLIPDAPPFSGSDSGAEGSPWYLMLESGQVCGFAGGATASIGDRRLNYFCDDGTEVYGDPDSSGPRWTIFVSDGSSTELSEVAIDIAWY